FVTGADTALYGQVRGNIVDSVEARAEMAAEHVMFVITQTAGDRQADNRAPVVLRKQRPDAVRLNGFYAASTGFQPEHAIVQFAIDILATDNEAMIAEELVHRNVDARIQGILAALKRAEGARQERIFRD